MLPKVKKGSNKKLLILVLVVLLLLIIRQKSTKFNEFIDNALYPLQSKLYILEDRFHRVYTEVSSYPKILENREKLRRENTLLSIENLRNRSLRSENERLKSLLEMKISNPKIKIATVGFRSIDDLSDFFYVNLGSTDGVTTDTYAISGSNLVGKVVEVMKDHSKVKMVTNNQLKISAVTDRNILGIINGSDVVSGELVFNSTLIKDDVKIGDEITTSGVSDIYPKGLKLGRIVREGQEQGEFIVDPELDLINLKEVVLIEKE